MYHSLQPVKLVAIRGIFHHLRKSFNIQLIIIICFNIQQTSVLRSNIFNHRSSPLPSLTSPVIHIFSICSPEICFANFSNITSVKSVKYRPFRSPSNVPYLNFSKYLLLFNPTIHLLHMNILYNPDYYKIHLN